MEKLSVKEIVTEKIINKIKSGELVKWENAFHYTKRNAMAKHDYSFLNQLLLSGSTSEFYLTANQCKAIAIDFKGTHFDNYVTFWKILKTVDKTTGKETTIPMLRYFKVTGLDTFPESEVKEKLLRKLYGDKKERNIDIDSFIANTGITIEMNGNGRACYSPSLDRISLPKMDIAKSAKRYYKTMFHELVHATGYSTRLNRELNTNMNDESYSKEELTAEIGASMLCNYFGIADDELDDNSASYCKDWLTHLQNDVNLIISASSKADKAVKFLLGVREEIEKEVE
jgi:antirestriction protein ArdC